MKSLQNDLKQTLVGILGEQNIADDADALTFFSQDVFSISEFETKAVLKPNNVQELAKCVQVVTEAGYAVFPRGGGMSYTKGYLPTVEKAVTFDLSNMDRVLEINLEDMYVTVEPACTWEKLHSALQDKGVRPPFWGTLSGLRATVGGSVSQNSLFYGSGKHGSAADSVIGLSIVAADGEIINTGSGALKDGNKFFRHYGPDLTGIFTSDAGSLGIKAAITLKLIRNPQHRCFGSFSFDSYEEMIPVMSEIGREGLASEIFGLDPSMTKKRMKRLSFSADVKSLAGVVKSSDGIVDAVKKSTKIAVAGRHYMKDVLYSLHVTTENRYEDGAEADLDTIRKIVKAGGGDEIENSMPMLINANPFLPLNTMIGPNGERWVPAHAIMPHSKMLNLLKAIDGFFAKYTDVMDRLGIETGAMFVTVHTTAILVEPVFFWPDALKELHLETVEKRLLNSIKGFDENLEAREFVVKLRTELAELFLEHSSAHLQIGKTYLYSQGLEENSISLLKSIKKHLDPDNLINPGALGL